MIIMIALMLFLVWYYKNIDKKLQNYTPVTAYVTLSEYDWHRHKPPGGLYRTTVQYWHNGTSYTQQLMYDTKKMHEHETIDCLVNPQKPQEIYPAAAHAINKRMMIFGWCVIAFCTIYPMYKILLLLYMS